MKELSINLNSISDVKKFVSIASSLSVDLDVVKGRYVVDGKSIMGLFNLDLSQPVKLIIHAEEEEASSIAKVFDQFVVKEK